MPILTLTTDFGFKDGFAGTMKGVIWGICLEAQIADISHTIEPQNVLEGAFTLWRAYSFFPAGAIHVAVVDPGVGTQRRPLAMRAGKWYFVGPDNGLFTPVLADAEKNGWPVEICLPDECQLLAARCQSHPPRKRHLRAGWRVPGEGCSAGRLRTSHQRPRASRYAEARENFHWLARPCHRGGCLWQLRHGSACL